MLLIYDTEIQNCIPDRDGWKSPNYRHCDGWHDFEGMGISVIGCWTDKYGYDCFLGSQTSQFQKLVDEADEVVGFNSISFDDRLLAANGVRIQTTYDLMREVRRAAGEPLTGPCTRGYNLNRLAGSNLGKWKTGEGSLAPKLWQDGKFREVIDYCLNDVQILKELYEKRACLIDPVYSDDLLHCGGDRREYIRELKRRKNQEKALWWKQYLKEWEIYFWAVTHADITGCRVRLPIEFSRHQTACHPYTGGRTWSFGVTLQIPHPAITWKVKTAYSRDEFEDDIPF